ncbi:hypothetical protein BDV25DRAFT_92451 [Aspergillus avenaceus]|uniref:MIT domain-containing protein n=1 Tax=Aspergillus avenaceus TaxID=36643 RepID=A0A5N6TYQ0_ASPAV|nr:hypothetical protein BDV25DRAFT_92451 [Aspergillus avenaceus]
MTHNISLEGHERPSRPLSPALASAVNRPTSQLYRINSRNQSNMNDSDIAEFTSRPRAVTPTSSGLATDRAMEYSTGSLGDDDIRGGLGSLNRWSQSTVSSKGSPRYRGHRRGAYSKASINDDCTSPKGSAHLERNNTTHFPPRAAASSMDHESPLQGRRSNTVNLSSKECETMDNNISSKIATAVVDAREQHPEAVLNEPAPISGSFFHNPWSKASVGHHYTNSTDSVLEPHTDNAMGRDGSPDQSLQHLFGGSQVHGKRRRGHSQKAMLSKALQKANTAVLLDNAANFEGAMEAYNDACQLLQLVMLRSSGGEEERLKLQEIRDTYMTRVTELQRMDFTFTEPNSKALPERPLSQESYSDMFQLIEEGEDEAFLMDTKNQVHRDPDHHRLMFSAGSLTSKNIAPARQSLLPSALDDDGEDGENAHYATSLPSSTGQQDYAQAESSQISNDVPESPGSLVPNQISGELRFKENSDNQTWYSEFSLLGSHARDPYESTSWLDTIDESGASSPASMRSKASSLYLRHRRSRHLSYNTEAEFDAALDAAVEAAYDDGLEPVIETSDHYVGNDDVVANARRNVELAKQKVREAELEAQVATSSGREVRTWQQQRVAGHPNVPNSDYLDEEAEEEERLLEEMTRGYVMDDFKFDLQSKSALPRQSDSSSFSGRTWESSTASNTTASGPTLSPLAEDNALPTVDTLVEQDTMPSTNNSFPAILPKQNLVATPGPSVRARRMSGQNTAELKIETNPQYREDLVRTSQDHPTDSQLSRPPPPLPKDETQPDFPPQTSRTLGPTTILRSAMRSNKRNTSISSIIEDISIKGSLEKASSQEEDNGPGLAKVPPPARPIGKVPSAPDNLGKTNSTLKSFRARNVSVPGLDPVTISPDTPSSGFPTFDAQKGAGGVSVPVLPTPTGTNFAPNGLPSGGLYLFDSHIHSPTNLGSPNITATNAPAPLEPCPDSFLLRPFWLMRCIYQTIAHPSGGYLTTKLFVPRDVWRVKNVKVKAVEEKVSNCDLLTAALLKLAKVDTYDADAILEEMQSFESVLDQVQSSLSKKLGSEVGVQGSMALFRTSQGSDDAATVDTLPSKTSSGASKSYLTSWRKLRSKNSGFGGTLSLSNSRETSKDNLTISSLPMTSVLGSQSVKRNPTQLQFNGPNAHYMGALARLCDAAQVLDQIAQQVEDPGLKHSSPTLVGLELSTRHAAEFFGFYICRFALNDIAMMLDKFIKRGSEWVLI